MLDSSQISTNLVSAVKIKQEKLTPPPSPTAKTSLTDNLLDNIFSDGMIEKKPDLKPLKSSNEILADLFKVFNAEPPAINEKDNAKKHKKKHKKEKKSKTSKHKKKGRSSSDEDSSTSSDNIEKEYKSKLKKLLKKKKEKRKHSGDETEENSIKSQKRHKPSMEEEKAIISDVVVKKEKEENDGPKKKKKLSIKDRLGEKVTSDDKDKERSKEKDKEREKDRNKEKDKDKDREKDRKSKERDKSKEREKDIRKQSSSSSTSNSNSNNNISSNPKKIVIKDLVNSVVYKETLKEVDMIEKQKKERKHKRRSSRSYSKSTSLSLSDEETYLREREHRYKPDHSEHDRRDSTDFYGDHRSRYRDRDGRRYDRDSYKGRSRDRSHERPRNRSHRSRNAYRSSIRSRSNSRYNHDRRRSRSSSRSRRENSENRIDKKRLLEIARKNAITMLKNGTLPGTQNMAPDAKEKVLAKMRYGGKTVDELTEFCKKLSNGEATGYLSNVSEDSDVDQDGNEKAFHHPFVLKDRGPIVMNIKNSNPIPPKTSEQTKALLMQFPVSSGQHHRLNENEWVPVVPPKPAKKGKELQQQTPAITITRECSEDAPSEQLLALPAPVPAPLPVPAPVPAVPVATPVPAPTTVIPEPQLLIESQPQQNISIFPDIYAGKDLDVSSIITQRLNAMRKLQDNPLDSEALKLMYNTQKDMSAWANSKFVPGQFTGTTGANVLSAKELTSGFQAWAKRDQLISTTPVSGGMGMHLLQKMGWRPGEGLGKEKNGSLQPLLLEVKLDKKGLVATEENPNSARRQGGKKRGSGGSGGGNSGGGGGGGGIAAAQQAMESKHPVSLLGELCAKRKYGAPFFEVVAEQGPFHHRTFLFKVTINNMVYQPAEPSLNKKEAKAVAARHALQQMGILPPSAAS